MAPRKRVQSQEAGAAQAPGDNVKKRRVAASVAASCSTKRKRDSDAPDEAETSQIDQVKTKRPKWGRIAGRLAGLMELPVDILFEIFGHLLPLDVLRLARTTKQFRLMLMHRSSLSIWIAARRNVPDLPSCPPYMSEPQFANLVFDTHCHECLSPNIRSVDFRIGRRICAKCAKVCMVEDYSPLVGESVHKLVPCKYGKRGRPCYYSKDVLDFQSKKASLTNPEERQKFNKERQSLVAQMEKHGALLEGWATNQAKDRSEHLDDLRRERKEAIVEKLTELGWGSEIERIPYRDDLSHHRLVKQPTRLTSRIWANIQNEMVGYMQRMRTERLERERKALVITRKRIAVSVLRAYKTSRLPFTDVMPEPMDFCAFSQVSEILELPTETQVTEETFAPVVEKMDELVNEWRATILGSLVQKVKDSLHSAKSDVNRQNGSAGSTSLDDAAGSSSVDPKGKGKAKAVGPRAPEVTQIIQELSLVTTVFNCKCCNPHFGIVYGLYDTDFSSDTDYTSSEDDILGPWGFGLGSRRTRPRSNPLFYPKVLGHRCLTKQNESNWDNAGGDPTKQCNQTMGTRTRWACHLLQVDEKAGKMAANVVSTCGLNPEITTVDEMDQMNYQLACLECLSWSNDEWNLAEAQVFSWRAAVTHNCRSHPSNANIEWKLIDDELAPEVVNVEEESNKSIFSSLMFHGLVPGGLYTGPAEEVVWLCAHCLDLPSETDCMDLSTMKDHLSAKHSISVPQENQDYYRDYESPQGRKARMPQLKISLTMERPDDVPGPGERHTFDPWGFGFSEDEFEDGYDSFYDDYDIFF